MDSASTQDIVKWAERKAAPPSDKPKGKRLTQSEVGLLLQMHREGKTQTEIAQLLGITQPAVHKWIQNVTDSTETAKLFLRGSALRMAQNIVNRGMPRDHVQALNGLGVLQAQENKGFTLVINGLELHGLGASKAQPEAVEGEVLSPPLLEGGGEGAEKA